MTNYRGRLGFHPRAWLDLQITTFVSSHVSKPTSADYPEAGRVCRISAYDAINHGTERSALRCKNVAASHECIATLVAGAASSCLELRKKWNCVEYCRILLRVRGHIPLYLMLTFAVKRYHACC